MRALVPQQRGAQREGLAAHRTLEGVLAQVSPLVLDERGAVAEALAALQAFVGLLARVRALVLGELRALDEALAALGAAVGPKLKRVMERTENCNDQRMQASGSGGGCPEAFTQSNIALCWG